MRQRNKNSERKNDTSVTKNTTTSSTLTETNHLQASSESLKPSGGLLWKCFSSLKYICLILIIPPFLNYGALLQEFNHLMPQGALFDVGFGQKIFLACNGTGLPTVILDAPTGVSSDVWTLVFNKLSDTTKVCMYDRAGLGFSERPFENRKNDSDTDEKTKNRWHPFTVERMADDLHQLITFSSQQPRPLILVGAELGALVARFYAQIYEGDVTDVVLIDPLPEDLFTYDSNVWSHFWSEHLVPRYQSMQFSAAVGLSRISLMIGNTKPPMHDSLPNDAISRQKHLLCNPRHLSTVVDEHYFINETFSQMKTVLMMKAFPHNVSVTVINGNYYDELLPSELNEAWAKGQQNLVSKLHPNSKQIVVNGADHTMLYRQPDAIVEPVKKLVQKWRSKQRDMAY